MYVLKCILSAVLGYLLGNISGGVLIARGFGIADIRKHGSGSSGTTNVLRTVGWLPSVLTLVCDCLKGCVACWLGKWLAGDLGMLLGGFCAVVGHDFPVFMGFKGGKGIATSLALIIAIHPLLALAELLTEIIVVAVTRYMSVASIITAIAFPVFTAILCRGRENYGLFVAFSTAAGALALFQHRSNIQRLIRGEENRLDFAKISQVSRKVMDKMKHRDSYSNHQK